MKLLSARKFQVDSAAARLPLTCMHDYSESKNFTHYFNTRLVIYYKRFKR
jgi:hypothetical protein